MNGVYRRQAHVPSLLRRPYVPSKTASASVTITCDPPSALVLTSTTPTFTETIPPTAGILILGGTSPTFTETLAHSAGTLALGAGTNTPGETLSHTAGVLNLAGGSHTFTGALPPAVGILVLGATAASISGSSAPATTSVFNPLLFMLEAGEGQVLIRSVTMTSTGSRLVAAANGSATLWSVNINTGAASAVLKIYNAESATGTPIATIDASTKSSHAYGVRCGSGIYLDLSGGNADCTVGYA